MTPQSVIERGWRTVLRAVVVEAILYAHGTRHY
jgi:hypothetical protein